MVNRSQFEEVPTAIAKSGGVSHSGKVIDYTIHYWQPVKVANDGGHIYKKKNKVYWQI